MEQKDLSRKADQPGQPGKGKSCWHPLGCSVRFNHWTDSQSATKTLISLISNFSCFDPLYRIMTSFALLWRLFTERKCTETKLVSQTVAILISNSVKCHSAMYISVYWELSLHGLFSLYWINLGLN